MLQNAWDWIKNHVWLTIGLVVGIFLLMRMSPGGSSASSAPGMPAGPDPTVVQAGAALEAARLEAQSQQQALAASVEMAKENNAAQLALAEIAADLETLRIHETGDLEARRIDVEGYTTREVSTLNAALASEQIRAQEELGKLNTWGTVRLAEIDRDIAGSTSAAQIAAMNQNAELTRMLIGSQERVQIAGYKAASKSTEQKGLFDLVASIF